MKFLFIFLVIYSNQLLSQSSIYDQNVQSATGKATSLSGNKGKKMAIVAISPSNLKKKGAITYWDSIQAANPSVVIIIVPANDITTTGDTTTDVGTLKPASNNVILTGTVSAKKDKASSQDPLMQWLTHANQNLHFDYDVNTDNQLYVISESGVLYAVLEKGVSNTTIDAILKQPDVKPQNTIAPDLIK